MRSGIRGPLVFAALALACAAPGTEQAAESAAVSAASGANTLSADLLSDISQVEQKMIGLARAIPASKYDWRPAAGVRSVAEVLKHVSADNYLMPAALGNAPDSATGIKGDDYNTAVAFEKREMNHDAIIAELEKSFAFLKTALQNATPDVMTKQASLFGQTFTGQQVWVMTVTHAHEHLGQMIAYARSNGVVPPWSN
jgi:uncharacterized damage-inducible protein DinB